MARKVALINMKGGVGKSTLAANIAWELATRPWNKKVLVVDLDPQFNCSQYLLGILRVANVLNQNAPTVWDVFEQFTTVPGRQNIPQFDPYNAVVSVYGNPRLTACIDLIPSRLELSQTLKNPTGKEQLLAKEVSRIEDDYDVVIIDCAPTESILTTAAYFVADNLLVPVRPEFMSTVGLPLLEQSLQEFATRYPNRAPTVLGIVFNAMSNYSPEEVTSRREVINVAAQNQWYVFSQEIRYSKSFPKGAREGRPLFSTSYARTNVKQNFRAFSRELAQRMGL